MYHELRLLFIIQENDKCLHLTCTKAVCQHKEQSVYFLHKTNVLYSFKLVVFMFVALIPTFSLLCLITQKMSLCFFCNIIWTSFSTLQFDDFFVFFFFFQCNNQIYYCLYVVPQRFCIINIRGNFIWYSLFIKKVL